MVQVEYKLLNSDAKLPTYGSSGAAGLDLYSTENVKIRTNDLFVIKVIFISLMWMYPLISNPSQYQACAFYIISIVVAYYACNNSNRILIGTGITLAIPEGYYGRIAPRSGLACKHGIDVMAGVIDSDYRGEIKVLLINLGGRDLEIKKGDRIAQLVIESIAKVDNFVELEPNLNRSDRGEGGFGSTGGFS